MKTSIGRTIRILRTAKGLKLSELAKNAGLSVALLSLVENDERQPSLDALRKIAGALRVPPEALMLMAVGEGSALRSNDRRTVDLTKSIQDLIRLEERLRALLDSQEDVHGDP